MVWCNGCGVQVGKSIWKELLEGKQHELFIAPQMFPESVSADLLPPYRYGEHSHRHTHSDNNE